MTSLVCKEDFVSASEIGTAIDCLRKWFISYVLKIREPETAAQKLGTEYHTCAENYYLTGGGLHGSSKVLKMAGAALPMWPRLGTHIELEQWFFFQTKCAAYKGLKDQEYIEGGTLVIGDHKSISAIKWAKTPDQLLTDPQAVIYAVDGLRRFPKVKLRWMTVDRNTYRVKLTEQTITRDHAKNAELWSTPGKRYTGDEVEKRFQYIDSMALLLRVLRKNVKDPNELPPSLETCGKYGGCAHKCNHCKVSKQDAFQRMLSLF